MWRTTQLELFKEAEYIQILQTQTKYEKTRKGTNEIFYSLMKIGKLRSAVRTIDSEVNTTEVLKLDKELNGRTVKQLLLNKHPSAVDDLTETTLTLEYYTFGFHPVMKTKRFSSLDENRSG
ncbi:hypothetical protein GJ496_004409 [Pomphorhynchus laevis]|nr:hypothetical protein GJ496_004409 [Pomphorhynchus laevis]